MEQSNHVEKLWIYGDIPDSIELYWEIPLFVIDSTERFSE